MARVQDLQGTYVRMYIFKLLGQYFLCTVFASYVVSTKLKLIMNVLATVLSIHQHKDGKLNCIYLIWLPNSIFLNLYIRKVGR